MEISEIDYEDALDSEEFYEVCQRYRHAQDAIPLGPGFPTAAEAFEQLKEWIRGHCIVSTEPESHGDERNG